jgi:molybdopterin-guanine dinucleotide biosynthesis protein A
MSRSMRSAAILAGGRASRFGGRDKGALVVDGMTIRDRQLAELAKVADDVRMVTHDRVPGCGALGGIHTALVDANHDRVFVVACDMPFVVAPFVEFLFDLAEEADAVVPKTTDGYHPVCAVYTRACIEPIARRLAERRLRAIDLLDDVRTRIVTADEIERFGGAERLLANVNTPAEYAGLEALQGHKL